MCVLGGGGGRRTPPPQPPPFGRYAPSLFPLGENPGYATGYILAIGCLNFLLNYNYVWGKRYVFNSFFTFLKWNSCIRY